MSRLDKKISYYKTKTPGAAVDINSKNIPSGKSVIIKAIDFTCTPNQKSVIRIKVNGSVVSAAQMDKFIKVPLITITGSATFDIEIDNSNSVNSAYIGATIYYEELG